MLTAVSLVTVLQLVLDPASVTRDLPMAAVAREVQTIWQPYVQVVVKLPGDAWVPTEPVVHLRMTEAPTAAGTASGTALAWIEFVDGKPAPLITVSVHRARQTMSEAVWLGRPLRLLPAATRTRFMSRAIGRAIAHEVGHYVLRSTAHPPEGLMRARFTVFDLMDGNMRNFRLTHAQEQELRIADYGVGVGATARTMPIAGEVQRSE